MSDLFGAVDQAPPPSRVLRDTRPSVAEQKAQLLLVLGRYINAVPISVRNGSIDLTRKWRAARQSAAAVAGNSRSSVGDLTHAIETMVQFL